MVRRIVMVVALLWTGLATAAQAAETVRVGGYEFPPFVESTASRAPKGLTLDLIAAMNKAQDHYDFQFVPISARRRYDDIEKGRIDLMMFESPEWEWQARDAPVDFSSVFLTGGEVYVALAAPGRGQDWFDDLKGKRLVGILGYHYGFAGFDANPEELVRDWNMKLVTNPDSSLSMVLAGRMDVAVVTDSYLWSYFNNNPGVRERLLVSDRYDQRYNHRILVRRNGPITVAEVDALLGRMRADGILDRLWQAAGIAP